MKKLFCLILAVLILVSSAITANAATGPNTKNPKRALAVVYDNSFSMYKFDSKEERRSPDQPFAWCRAIYAMQAFATMMNENDVMQIYPMHPITVNGKEYTSKKPMTVTQKNAGDIQNIYTPDPGGTPIESIEAAYNGLTKTSADEKWLIVLTDGDVFSEDGVDLDTKKEVEKGNTVNTVKKLDEVLGNYSKKVKVMYLGIGKLAVKPTLQNGGNFFADKATDSAQVLEKLSAMCNMIFGRLALPNVDNKTRKLDFDVTMSKLIVFIQGSGISNVKLGNLTPTSSDALKYSKKGHGRVNDTMDKTLHIDENLQGMMLTFTNVDAGAYDLSFDGKESSVVCYFEPDVDLRAQVLNSKKEVINVDSKLVEGKYTLKYELIDRKTNKPTNSPLLGNQNYKVSYTVNGKEKTFTSKKGDSIEFTMGEKETLDVYFEVTYLDDYTIVRTSGDLGWPEGGLTFLPSAGELIMTVSGGNDDGKYSLSTLEEEAKYKLNFTLNKKECNREQLDGMKVKAKLEGGNAVAKVTRDDNGEYYVTVNYNKTALETEPGNYELNITAQYVDKADQISNQQNKHINLSIDDDSRNLEMLLDVEQTYYQFSKIKDSKPIVLKVFFSGDPLTEEEMKALKVSLTEGDVKVDIVPDYENSCYKVYFDPENPPEKGSHKLTFKAEGKNEIGKTVEVEQKTRVKFGSMPMWLRILLPILIILFLLLLIYLFMRQKVLPKGMDVENVQFKVSGMVPGNTICEFTKESRTEGSVKIKSANYPADPGARTTITLDFEALDNRWVFKSKERRVVLTKIKILNTPTIKDFSVAGSSFKPDKAKPTVLVGSNGNPLSREDEIQFSDGSHIDIRRVTDSGNSVNFQCDVIFK